MQHDNEKPFDGGPAYPSIQQKVVLPADEKRPFNVLGQPMNGMSVRDVATLEILSALIAARCKPYGFAELMTQPAKPEWVIEAMDMADVFLELRGQI
jgi:hypothetical protein